MAILIETVSNSEQARNDLQKLETSVKKIEQTTSSAAEAAKKMLSSLTAGIAAFGSLAVLTKYSDSITELESKLRLVVGTQEKVNKAFKDISIIAIKTKSDIGSIVKLYSKVATSGKEYGLSLKSTKTFVENITKAMNVSGASAIEASNAILQLTQALASNRLSGDELRSIMEAAPEVGRYIAEGMGISFGKIREFAEAGQLNFENVVNAILKQTDKINSDFEKIGTTFEHAFSNVGSSVFLLFRSIKKEFFYNTDYLAKWINSIAIKIAEMANNIKYYSLNIRSTFIGFSGTLRKITAFVISSFNFLIIGITSFLSKISSFVKDSSFSKSLFEVIDRIKAALSYLKENSFKLIFDNSFVNNIIKYLSQQIEIGLSFFDDLYKSVKQNLFENIKKIDISEIFPNLNKVIEYIKNFTDSIYNFFYDLWDKLVGHSIVPDIVNGITDWFIKLKDLPLKAVKFFTEASTKYFSALMLIITRIFAIFTMELFGVSRNVKIFVGLLITAVTLFVNTINFVDLEELKKNIKEIFEGIIKIIYNTVAYLKTAIFEKLPEGAIKILLKLKAIGLSIKNVLVDSFENIIESFSNLEEKFEKTDILKSIKDLFYKKDNIQISYEKPVDKRLPIKDKESSFNFSKIISALNVALTTIIFSAFHLAVVGVFSSSKIATIVIAAFSPIFAVALADGFSNNIVIKSITSLASKLVSSIGDGIRWLWDENPTWFSAILLNIALLFQTGRAFLAQAVKTLAIAPTTAANSVTQLVQREINRSGMVYVEKQLASLKDIEKNLSSRYSNTQTALRNLVRDLTGQTAYMTRTNAAGVATTQIVRLTRTLIDEVLNTKNTRAFALDPAMQRHLERAIRLSEESTRLQGLTDQHTKNVERFTKETAYYSRKFEALDALVKQRVAAGAEKFNVFAGGIGGIIGTIFGTSVGKNIAGDFVGGVERLSLGQSIAAQMVGAFVGAHAFAIITAMLSKAFLFSIGKVLKFSIITPFIIASLSTGIVGIITVALGAYTGIISGIELGLDKIANILLNIRDSFLIMINSFVGLFGKGPIFDEKQFFTGFSNRTEIEQLGSMVGAAFVSMVTGAYLGVLIARTFLTMIANWFRTSLTAFFIGAITASIGQLLKKFVLIPGFLLAAAYAAFKTLSSLGYTWADDFIERTKKLFTFDFNFTKEPTSLNEKATPFNSTEFGKLIEKSNEKIYAEVASYNLANQTILQNLVSERKVFLDSLANTIPKTFMGMSISENNIEMNAEALAKQNSLTELETEYIKEIALNGKSSIDLLHKLPLEIKKQMEELSLGERIVETISSWTESFRDLFSSKPQQDPIQNWVKKASGGFISGPGGPKEDKVPAMLSNGEFVINAKAARENAALLTAINNGWSPQGFANGLVSIESNSTKSVETQTDHFEKIMKIFSETFSKLTDKMGEMWDDFSGRNSVGNKTLSSLIKNSANKDEAILTLAGKIKDLGLKTSVNFKELTAKQIGDIAGRIDSIFEERLKYEKARDARISEGKISPSFNEESYLELSKERLKELEEFLSTGFENGVELIEAKLRLTFKEGADLINEVFSTDISLEGFGKISEGLRQQLMVLADSLKRDLNQLQQSGKTRLNETPDVFYERYSLAKFKASIISTLTSAFLELNNISRQGYASLYEKVSGVERTSIRESYFSSLPRATQEKSASELYALRTIKNIVKSVNITDQQNSKILELLDRNISAVEILKNLPNIFGVTDLKALIPKTDQEKLNSFITDKIGESNSWLEKIEINTRKAELNSSFSAYLLKDSNLGKDFSEKAIIESAIKGSALNTKETFSSIETLSKEMQESLDKKLSAILPYFEKASELTGVNINLLKAIGKAESGFDPKAVSEAGAKGVMQLIEATGRYYKVFDPFDAKQNIVGGSRFFSDLMEKYQNIDKALAAYNWGETAFDKKLKALSAVNQESNWKSYLPQETKNYIEKVNLYFKEFGGTIEDAIKKEGDSLKENGDNITAASKATGVSVNKLVDSLENNESRVLDTTFSQAERLFNDLNNYGFSFGLSKEALETAPQAVLTGIENYISKLKNIELELLKPNLTDRAKITLENEKIQISENLEDIVLSLTNFGMKLKEANSYFVSNLASGFNSSLQALLKGEINFKEFGDALLNKFTSEVINQFVNGLTDALFAKNGIFGSLFKNLGGQIFGLGSALGGEDKALPALANIGSSINKTTETVAAGNKQMPGLFSGLGNIISSLFSGIGSLFSGSGSSGGLLGSFSNLFSGGSGGSSSWNIADMFGFSKGGFVSGPGSGISDSIPAMLSNGEFVVNARAAKRNFKLLSAINNNKISKFSNGGIVGKESIVNDTFGNSQVFNINITGDISRQTKAEIYGMIPQLASSISQHNFDRNYRR